MRDWILYRGKFVSVIIAAAGQGKRMNCSINKQYLMLRNKPILAHTLQVFEKCMAIDEIIIVTHHDEMEYCQETIVKFYNFKKVTAIVPGGDERQESVYHGLKAVDHRCDIVMIHDGARPFIKKEQVMHSIDGAIKHEAVGIGVPIKDTIKVVDEGKNIIDTPDRKFLWAIQTPQTFTYNLLVQAHERAQQEGFLGTDDAVLVERMNKKVKMMMGSYDNIKITTREDLYIGEYILKTREQGYRNMKERKEMKVGVGYDVHRLVYGRKLILGGVEIPYEKGLLGHSDADVLLHAIKDALLGALALGDIGRYFPDTDPRFKNVLSIKLLYEVNKMLQDRRYQVNNIDATIIAQKPKMAPYIEAMRRNIATTLKIEIERINVKATTTEGLGFTGTGEGIAAQAIVSVVPIHEV